MTYHNYEKLDGCWISRNPVTTLDGERLFPHEEAFAIFRGQLMPVSIEFGLKRNTHIPCLWQQDEVYPLSELREQFA